MPRQLPCQLLQLPQSCVMQPKLLQTCSVLFCVAPILVLDIQKQVNPDLRQAACACEVPPCSTYGCLSYQQSAIECHHTIKLPRMGSIHNRLLKLSLSERFLGNKPVDTTEDVARSDIVQHISSAGSELHQGSHHSCIVVGLCRGSIGFGLSSSMNQGWWSHKSTWCS